MVETRPRRVLQTAIFAKWLSSLRDGTALVKIGQRLQRIEDGNFGDVRPVGGTVSEIRIDHGPGYRVYFTQRGKVVVVLLCGGDKASQSRDIERAKELAQQIEEQSDDA